MAPSLAVPRPKNRGGDPVVSLRTKELAAFVAKAGCDVVEAKSCAVAVEAPNAATRGSGGGVTFQEAFERQTAKDPDMAKKIDGIDAVIGTLPHSHFNCVLRNIRSGSPGCTCGSPGVTCACDNTLKAFLTAEGNYDCDALKRFDESWGELVDHGMPWEIFIRPDGHRRTRGGAHHIHCP